MGLESGAQFYITDSISKAKQEIQSALLLFFFFQKAYWDIGSDIILLLEVREKKGFILNLNSSGYFLFIQGR